MTVLNLYFDGACTPNPKGFASYGIYLKEFDERVSDIIGIGEGMTNQVAEYTALLEGLKLLKEHCMNGDEIKIFGDSQLVIKQINGEWKIKDNRLKTLYNKCIELIREIESQEVSISFMWVPREKNTIADELSERPLKQWQDQKGLLKCSCGGTFILRPGKRGLFFGCSNYQTIGCRNTHPFEWDGELPKCEWKQKKQQQTLF